MFTVFFILWQQRSWSARYGNKSRSR